MVTTRALVAKWESEVLKCTGERLFLAFNAASVEELAAADLVVTSVDGLRAFDTPWRWWRSTRVLNKGQQGSGGPDRQGSGR